MLRCDVRKQPTDPAEPRRVRLRHTQAQAAFSPRETGAADPTKSGWRSARRSQARGSYHSFHLFYFFSFCFSLLFNFLPESNPRPVRRGRRCPGDFISSSTFQSLQSSNPRGGPDTIGETPDLPIFGYKVF